MSIRSFISHVITYVVIDVLMCYEFVIDRKIIIRDSVTLEETSVILNVTNRDHRVIRDQLERQLIGCTSNSSYGDLKHNWISGEQIARLPHGSIVHIYKKGNT
jgi:acetone carboxylase gamma subunit